MVYQKRHCHKSFSPKIARAFTLIEMLVVIAIIGVLASLVAPALRNAYQTALAISCKNTMRNLGLLINDYLETNQKLPPYCDGNYDPAYGRWQTFIALSLNPDLPRHQRNYCDASVCELFTCTALKNSHPLAAKIGANEVHFGLNYYMLEKGIQRLRAPGKRFMLGEPVIPDKKERYCIANNAAISGCDSDPNPPRHSKQPVSPALFADWHMENVITPFVPDTKPKKYISNSTDHAKYYFWGNGYTD